MLRRVRHCTVSGAVLTFALVGAVGRGWFPWQLVVSEATLVTRQAASVVLTVAL